jgi:hypothetical protein
MTRTTQRSCAWPCSSHLVARTLREAATAFLEPLRQVVSCVTDAVLIGAGYHPDPEHHALTFRGDTYPRLRGPWLLLFSVIHRYRIVPTGEEPKGRRVNTLEYGYELLDERERTVLAYHWHPVTVRGPHRITYPHLHIGGQPKGSPLAGHLPSGRVALEDVIRFLVAELGVQPRRADWQQVLDETERQFRTTRTWT